MPGSTRGAFRALLLFVLRSLRTRRFLHRCTMIHAFTLSIAIDADRPSLKIKRREFPALDTGFDTPNIHLFDAKNHQKFARIVNTIRLPRFRSRHA